MRTLSTCIVVGAAALTLGSSLAAQRRARVGPLVSSITVDDGQSRAYTAFGGTVALLTGDDAEMGVAIVRYRDLSSNSCVRQLTFFGLTSLYYPVGPKGIAPFASTELGLARVTESNGALGVSCSLLTSVETSNQLGFAFGLGVRVAAGSRAAATVEGRFLQVPNSFIQGLEARGNVSVAFGSPRTTKLGNGTLGPALSFLAPISGPFAAHGPFVGVRFRRDTKKSGVLGLQIDYAPLRVTGCTSSCPSYAIVFAPGYEASLHTAWGRFYGTLGGVLAGFPEVSADRGVSQGAHGGLGADVFAGERLMVNLNARLLWIQRNTGENVFGVQVGASLSPKLEHAAVSR